MDANTNAGGPGFTSKFLKNILSSREEEGNVLLTDNKEEVRTPSGPSLTLVSTNEKLN